MTNKATKELFEKLSSYGPFSPNSAKVCTSPLHALHVSNLDLLGDIFVVPSDPSLLLMLLSLIGRLNVFLGLSF